MTTSKATPPPSVVPEWSERETLVGERRLRRRFMHFKDWDSQRAAKSEVSSKKENYTGREDLDSRSNSGNLKEKESHKRPGFRKTSIQRFIKKVIEGVHREPVCGLQWAHRGSGIGPVAFCVHVCRCGYQSSMSIILKPRSRSTSSLKNTEGMW